MKKNAVLVTMMIGVQQIGASPAPPDYTVQLYSTPGCSLAGSDSMVAYGYNSECLANPYGGYYTASCGTTGFTYNEYSDCACLSAKHSDSSYDVTQCQSRETLSYQFECCASSPSSACEGHTASAPASCPIPSPTPSPTPKPHFDIDFVVEIFSGSDCSSTSMMASGLSNQCLTNPEGGFYAVTCDETGVTNIAVTDCTCGSGSVIQINAPSGCQMGSPHSFNVHCCSIEPDQCTAVVPKPVLAACETPSPTPHLPEDYVVELYNNSQCSGDTTVVTGKNGQCYPSPIGGYYHAWCEDYILRFDPSTASDCSIPTFGNSNQIQPNECESGFIFHCCEDDIKPCLALTTPKPTPSPTPTHRTTTAAPKQASTISLGKQIIGPDKIHYLSTSQGLNIKIAGSKSAPTPTGTVTFYQGTKNLGIKTLVNGRVKINTLPQFFQGLYQIKVVYSGDQKHLSKTTIFKVFFFTYPQTGTYLINSNKELKTNTSVNFFNETQGGWSTQNLPINRVFNGWTKPVTAYACKTKFNVKQSSNNRELYNYTAVVGVKKIGTQGIASTTHVDQIVIVDTRKPKRSGWGKVVTTFCVTQGLL